MKNSTSLKKNRQIKLILQKILVFSILFSAIALFVYSLLFMTPFYEIYKMNGELPINRLTDIYHVDYNQFDPGGFIYKVNALTGETGEIKSLDMKYYVSYAYDVQPFNRMLFIFGIVAIVVSGILFIYRSQLRKKYYITNLVANSVVGVFNISIAAYLISQLTIWNSKLKDLEYELINIYYDYTTKLELDGTYTKVFSEGTFQWVFILGYIIIGIMLLASLTMIIYSFVKFFKQKKETQKKVEVIINE